MLPFEVTTGALPLSAGLVSMTLPEASVTVSISVDSAEASSLEASAGVLSSATVLLASAELSEGAVESPLSLSLLHAANENIIARTRSREAIFRRFFFMSKTFHKIFSGISARFLCCTLQGNTAHYKFTLIN